MSKVYEKLAYGFRYGSALITPAGSSYKTGVVKIRLETDKYPRGIQIYVTKTGKVRIISNEGEWKLERK